MTCLRIASHALRAFAPLALVTSILSAADLHAARAACGTGAFALSDAQDIAAIRGAVERACPCADFDGASDTKHSGYVKRAKAVIADAADGTPVLGAFTLRRARRPLPHLQAPPGPALVGRAPAKPLFSSAGSTPRLRRRNAGDPGHSRVLR